MFVRELPTLKTEEVTVENIQPTIDSPNMEDQIIPKIDKQKVKGKMFTSIKTVIGIVLLFLLLSGCYLLYTNVIMPISSSDKTSITDSAQKYTKQASSSGSKTQASSNSGAKGNSQKPMKPGQTAQKGGLISQNNLQISSGGGGGDDESDSN